MVNYFNSTGRIFILLFLSLLQLTFCLWLIIALVITLPYRLIVYSISKLFRSDLIGFVHGISGDFAADKIHTKPTMTLNYFIVLDGVISLERFQRIFRERIIDKTDGSTFVYKRFRHYWVGFMGYNFWKRDDKFNLNNHIKPYLPHKCNCMFTQRDLPKLMSELLPQPFQRNQSPWEILLLDNYKEDENSVKMVLMFRIHHALADGFSLLNVLQHDLPLRMKPLEIPKANYVDQSRWEKLVRLPLVLFELGSYFIDSHDRKNLWIFPKYSEASKTPPKGYFTSFTSSFQVARVREIKNKCDVSYLAVLLTCICEGVRRAMKEAGQSVPDNLGLMYVRPKPNHPKGLVNHWNVGMSTFPMHDMSMVSRVNAIEDQLIKEKRSMVSPAFSQVMNFMALLPTSVVHFMSKNILPAGFRLSNFPVAAEITSIEGLNITNIYVGMGTPFADRGAAIMMFGDGGKQSIVVTANQSSYCSQQLFEQLGTYIENALSTFETLSGKECYTHADG